VPTLRPIRIAPPTKGLTDFPERSPGNDGWSTQALNVEFHTGGVTTRGGSRRVVNNVYTQGGTARNVAVKVVKSFRARGWRDLVAIGYVPLAGGEANSERIDVRGLVSGDTFDPGFSDEVMAANAAAVNSNRGSRWDACVFWPWHRFAPDLVVCTDNQGQGNPNPSVFLSNWQQREMEPLVGINRTLVPFHGGAPMPPPTPTADDPGTYTTASLRARYCRVHANRLVLGNINGMNVNGLPNSQNAALWASNIGDHRGFCLENVFMVAGETSAITGLAEWRNDLAVFRTGTIGLFRLNQQLSSDYRHVVKERGCIAHSTILDDVGGAAMFLAPDGFYAFTGSPGLEHLSAPIQRTLRQAIGNAGDFIGGAHAVHFPRNRQVWLTVPMGQDSPEMTFVMDYNYSPPAWSFFEFQTAAYGSANPRKRVGGFATSFDGQRLFGVSHRVTGTIDYEEFNQPRAIDDQAAGTSIGFMSRWESGPIDFGKNAVNRWRYCRPTIRPQGAYNHTWWWRRDGQTFNGGGNHNGQSVDVSMAGVGGGLALGAFVLGTGRIGQAEDHSVRLDVYAGGVGRYGRVGIETNASAADRRFDIRGVEIDVLDRRLRR